MHEDFVLSFWQYINFGKYGAKESAKEWKELGANIAYSYNFNPKVHKEEEMIELLDECEKNGLKLIIVDRNLHWDYLVENGEEAYEESVKRSVKAFASHPACYAFMLGDEPNKDRLAAAEKAIIILQRNTDKPAFINLYPIWKSSGQDYVNLMGCTVEEWEDVLDGFIKRSGLRILAYDCYSCMTTKRKESGLHGYFHNLEFFSKVARNNNIPCWTSLLSMGHWGFKTPTLTDMRWQLSTAIASGMQGIQWFEIYELNESGEDYMEGGIRNRRGELTPQFYNVRQVNYELLDRKLFQYLPYLKYECSFHLGKPYGGYSYYFNGCLPNVQNFSSKFNVDGIITKFIDTRNNAECYMIVNNSLNEEDKDYFSVQFKDGLSKFNKSMWLPAGGFFFVATEPQEESGGNA